MESLILRQEQGFPVECEQLLLSGGSAGVEDGGEDFEAVGEAGEDLADVGDADFAADGG